MSLDPVSRMPAPSAVSRNAAIEQAGPVAVTLAGSTADSAQAGANPSLYLDPELGMVVMEFRSVPGVPERTIPSSQELEAYRLAARTGAPRPGEVPEPAETPAAA